VIVGGFGRTSLAGLPLHGKGPLEWRRKEAGMIELTEAMRKAIQERPGTPVRLVDPATQETFVLLRAEDYDRLTEYDDSSWTDEEMDLLHEEAARMADTFTKQP
jgi:hypothetical protein